MYCYIKPSEFKISISIESYDSQILIAQIEDLNENCVKISCPYPLYFLRNRLSKSFMAGAVHRFK